MPHELLVLNRDNHMLDWGLDSSDCVCRLGYERDAAGQCRECATGKFRGSQFSRYCEDCPHNTFQNNTAGLQCLSCPLNSSTFLQVGMTALQDCVCAAGFQAADGDCIPCPAGTFRNSRLANETLEKCLQCPENHYCPLGSVHPLPCALSEISQAGARQHADCLCPVGSGRGVSSEHANVCKPCAHGYFSSFASNYPCNACPRNKNTSSLGATNIANCSCLPGHGIQSENINLEEACTQCTDGFFAAGGTNSPCTYCGWGAVTEPELAAASSSQCQCNAQRGLYNLPK